MTIIINIIFNCKKYHTLNWGILGVTLGWGGGGLGVTALTLGFSQKSG